MFSASKSSAPAGGTITLTKSLRFRSSASAYLSRTPSSAGNRKTFTISYWAKRGTLGVTQYLFAAGSGTTESTWFQGGSFDNNGSSFDSTGLGTWTSSGGQTTAIYRDTSAWYHFVWAIDTTQATASNRVKIWVNNVQQTLSTDTITQNADLAWNNSGVVHYIGARIDSGPRSFFDGYLTEIYNIDGQALTPSSFGATNSTTGQWSPAKYTGTYGTNGFYLPFTNTTSTTTLGYDSSGNSNNWTTNNFSLTSGSTYDSMNDVPTLTSATAANYCVVNTLDKGVYITLADGNLKVSTATDWSAVRSTFGISSGKWYWEAYPTSSTSGNFLFGISKSNANQDTGLGFDANGWAYYKDGQKYNGGGGIAYGASYAVGDVIGVAFDANAGTLIFYKNGTSQGTAFTGLTSGPYFPAFSSYATAVSYANFGQQPFTYTPPTGYNALNTYNIPTGTVTTTGTFTGNSSADGPFVYLNGTPTAMTINANTVTFGTNANKLANGFKVTSSSSLYNLSGSNVYVVTTAGAVFKVSDAQSNP